MSSICLTTSWESLQTSSWSTSSEWARLRPAITASYWASLLEAWNPNLSAYSMSIPNIIVNGEGIHKTEEFMAGCGIYDEVDPRQRETVLWARSIDVSEVDTESPLTVFFFDKYDVGQPLRIFHLSDYSCLEEFVDFLVDGFLYFWHEAPPLLFDWLKGWADIQPMND